MTPGLRIARTTGEAALLVAAARSDGSLVLSLHGGDLADQGACRSALAEAFRFPAWAGSNWDAVADCLADLEWLEPGPRTLLLDGLPGRPGHGPTWADTLIEILSGVVRLWANTPSPLSVIVVPT